MNNSKLERLIHFVLFISCHALPDKIENALKQDIVSVFMVKLPSGCTGSIISKDWVISAAHCFAPMRNYDSAITEENGDVVVKLDEERGEFALISIPTSSRMPRKSLWTNSLMNNNQSTQNVSNVKGFRGFWRQIDTVILHGKFDGEALSWKGYDLALIKLSPPDNENDVLDHGDEGTVAPICLPRPEFNDLNPDNLFMAGYGRRFIPHCLTDSNGPERFGVCGRPVRCSKDHRARECGLKFLYEGEIHQECLKIDTPSSKNPECTSLWKEEAAMSDKTVHIFDNTSRDYVTTCYPKRSAKNSKGWCTTRAPGVDKNTEPTSDSGWGFCSDDETQKHCNEEIPDKKNQTAIRVQVLDSNFCNDKLENNLKVEQPETRRNDFENMREKSGVICIGKNITHPYGDDVFVYRSGNKYSSFKGAEKDIEKMTQNSSRYDINGGPSCFGDSGGPLFRIVDKNDTVTPVLVGVFSFMLWGTCQGEDEPGYYGRISHSVDWIQKYIPSNELCWM